MPQSQRLTTVEPGATIALAQAWVATSVGDSNRPGQRQAARLDPAQRQEHRAGVDRIDRQGAQQAARYHQPGQVADQVSRSEHDQLMRDGQNRCDRPVGGDAGDDGPDDGPNLQLTDEQRLGGGEHRRSKDGGAVSPTPGDC